MGMKSFLARVLQKTRLAFAQVALRFPSTLLYALTLGVITIYMNHAGTLPKEVEDFLARTAMTLGLGLPLSAAVTLLVERLAGKGDERPMRLLRALSQTATAAALALFGLFLTSDWQAGGGLVVPGRVAGLGLASVLLFIAIPRLVSRPRFVTEQIQLFFRILITSIFTNAIYGGICGVIAAADLLFVLHVDSKIYIDIVAATWAVFAPVFFLSGIPRPDHEAQQREYSLFIKVLGLYIIAPIASVYTFILYGYLLKILFTLTMPVNMVFNLVFWYAAIVLLVLIAIIPLREKSRFADLFSRWMPFVLLPLEAMMMFSLGIRIFAYGFTEPRYLGAIAGLWVIAVTVLFAVRSKTPYRSPALIPATLALVAVIAVVGPLSVFSITKWSQNARFTTILEKYSLVDEGTLVLPATPPAFSAEDQNSLDSIASRFAGSYGLPALRVLPADLPSAEAAVTQLGISTTSVPGGNPDEVQAYFNFSSDLANNAQLDISGYDILVPISAYLDPTGSKGSSPAEVGVTTTVDGPSMTLSVWKDGKRLTDIDMAAFVAEIIAANPDNLNGTTPLPTADLTRISDSGGIKVAFVARSLNGNFIRTAGVVTVQNVSIDGYLLLDLP
jgi:hypothetical protein